jgi:hypothetical protein
MAPSPKSPQETVLLQLDEGIEFYRRNARRQMRWYRVLKAVQVVVSFLVPTAVITLPGDWAKNVAGVLGALLAAIESFNQIFGFQRHWRRWRTAERALVREKAEFECKAGHYVSSGEAKQPEALLCERINSIMAQELAEWTADSMTSDKPKPQPASGG